MNKVNIVLKHLTSEQIQDISKRYYSKTSIKDLIAEFNINIIPSKLYKVLPPIEHVEKCEFCNDKLITIR